MLLLIPWEFHILYSLTSSNPPYPSPLFIPTQLYGFVFLFLKSHPVLSRTGQYSYVWTIFLLPGTEHILKENRIFFCQQLSITNSSSARGGLCAYSLLQARILSDWLLHRFFCFVFLLSLLWVCTCNCPLASGKHPSPPVICLFTVCRD